MAGARPPSGARVVEPLGIAIRQSTDVTAIDDPEIALAVKLIRENACKGMSVDDLLARVPLSRSILERRLRKHVGLSPMGLIRQTQIKRIRQLLVETELSLEQIGPLAGFRHSEHMCVVFKREVGQTPALPPAVAGLMGPRRDSARPPTPRRGPRRLDPRGIPAPASAQRDSILLRGNSLRTGPAP